MLSRHCNTVIRFLLAALLLVVNVGVPGGVAHSHADGDHPHVHAAHCHENGSGHFHTHQSVNVAIDGPTLVASHYHVHLSLFGINFLGVPSQSSPQDEQPSQPCLEVVGLTNSTCSSLHCLDGTQTIWASQPSHIESHVPIACKCKCDPAMDTVRPLCDAARQKRSGVLLS
jgi:hypothetical protein